MTNKPLIVILYDSIQNSVFQSQILEPLRKHKEQHPHQKIILISFEPKDPSLSTLKALNLDNLLCLKLFKRYPFIGFINLRLARRKIQKFLSSIPSYTIIARGPHAGWIATHAASKNHCSHITVQARGLLVEEFAYATKKTNNRFFSWLDAYRLGALKKLEQYIYTSSMRTGIPTTIQAVSPALRDYLITNYKTDPTTISIAHHDIPEPLSIEQRELWRVAVRTKLGITPHAHVYCYNGSIKPWACPEKVIEFFIQQQKKERNIFLLILTQEKEQFLILLKEHSLDPSYYFVCSVDHNEIYKYLAASDTGLIFREKNILNWISRPTKVLEYQAAGLDIIHNNTVALLVNQHQLYTKDLH